MKKFYMSVILLFLVSSMIACNLSLPFTPIQSAEDIYTAAAKTLVAGLTEQASLVALTNSHGTETQVAIPSLTMTDTSIPSATLIPTLTTSPQATYTNTPIPGTVTRTPIPCNAVSFVKDVTTPDGTQLLAGSAFVKTWRLKNVGSCTWNSAYKVVFLSGEQMSGPASFSLTPGVVAPNQVIDVSVNLVVPPSVGVKQGFWGLQGSDGVIFTLSTGPFWVKIKSVNIIIPTLFIPPPIVMLESEAPLVPNESGAIKSNNTKLAYPNIGDDSTNITYQGFLSFDISTLPATATIKKVELDLSDYDKLGAPYGLGCLRVYKQNYGTLDISDYFVGAPLGALARFCNDSDLMAIDDHSDMISAIQDQLGHSRVKFRVQFNETATDDDLIADMVRLGSDIKLIIYYIP